MAEASAAVAAPAPATSAPAAPAAAATPTQSAGPTLTSVPTGEWASGFKEEIKSYISQKGFKTPEALAESYKNLEAKLSTKIPEDKMIVLPDKMEGDAARAVWERLGAPKEATGYELAKDKADADPKFTEWAQGMFHKNNLTKAQALGVAQEYENYAKAQIAAQTEARANSLRQADETLKKQWGPHYEQNINLCSQGAKILGLDKKSLDLLEAIQGREKLFVTLKNIGVSVGESAFVDGGHAPTTPEMTAEQAKNEISRLTQDKKFGKKIMRGDVEARNQWDKLNRIAAPGEKQIG